MSEPTRTRDLLLQLEALLPENFSADFIQTWDHSLSTLQSVLSLTQLLQALHREGHGFRVFEDGLAVSLFRDKSTRTRFSFASAANAVGLATADLDERTSQIAHGETVRETATMISFMTRVIGIRDDMYIGLGQTYMREVAAAIDQGASEGVLHQRPGLINLQCDVDHPTQSMSDLAMLTDHFGGIGNLKGKKLAMSWAYSPSYGKPLSVPQGIIGLLTRFGMEVTLAHPRGYGLLPAIVERAGIQAQESGGSFRMTEDMDDAFQDADVVYPKSWAPFAVMQERTRLLQADDRQGLEELEQRCLQENVRYQDWECNSARMAKTREGQALYMHCLPADISGVSCEKGEVSADVFEQYRKQTYQEAGFKPFVIAALMLLTTCKRGDLLNQLSKRL